jgi:LacI family transcriptional regulator
LHLFLLFDSNTAMQRPSMAQVAALAAVSKNTVSLALRGSPRIPEVTRLQVEAAARKLGYRRNAAVGCLMAELRRSGSTRFEATLALLNANEDAAAFQAHPTVPVYVAGAKRRAAELGYATDEFWLHDPSMSGTRLAAILRARGIRGVLVIGLLRSNELPPEMQPIWNEFPAVVTGVRVRSPELSFAGADQYSLALKAYEKAWALGYRRPALVLDPVIDALIDGRFTAGYLMGERRFRPSAKSIEPFVQIIEARKDVRHFKHWLEASKPDVLFVLYHEVERWLEACGLRVPNDIGLIQYEWRAQRSHWAGMDQRNDLVGEAAVDLLVSMIHSGQQGVPERAIATLVTSQWVQGTTVRAPRVDSVLPLRASQRHFSRAKRTQFSVGEA